MKYLAAPYSDPDPKVVQERMEQVYYYLSRFIIAGENIVTPLAMHEVATRFDMDGAYSFWSTYCLDLLKRCDSMVVLKLEGWDLSRGLESEIDFCKENHIPISYVDPTIPQDINDN